MGESQTCTQTCEEWLPGLIFFYEFLDTIHLHGFILQPYQRFITLGNHGRVSGRSMKKLYVYIFFLEIFVIIFSKWFMTLEGF